MQKLTNRETNTLIVNKTKEQKGVNEMGNMKDKANNIFGLTKEDIDKIRNANPENLDVNLATKRYKEELDNYASSVRLDRYDDLDDIDRTIFIAKHMTDAEFSEYKDLNDGIHNYIMSFRYNFCDSIINHWDKNTLNGFITGVLSEIYKLDYVINGKSANDSNWLNTLYLNADADSLIKKENLSGVNKSAAEECFAKLEKLAEDFGLFKNEVFNLKKDMYEPLVLALWERYVTHDMASEALDEAVSYLMKIGFKIQD